MQIKDVIRAHRLRLGLTEQQLAERVGVSRGSVQQWETGKTAPKRNNQAAVAAALGIGVSELLGIAVSTTTPVVRFTQPVDDVIEIGHALQALDEHLQALAPVLQDAGRDILRKWLAGTATVDDAVQALEAMAMTSKAMGNKKD